MPLGRPQRPPAAVLRQADIDRLMTQATANKVIAGGACMLSAPLGNARSAVLHRQAYGFSTFEGGASKALAPNSLFDLGELTASLGPVVLCLLWAGQGRLDIRRPISLWLTETAQTPLGQVSISELLDHTSGLPQGDSRLSELVQMAPSPPRPHVRDVSEMQTPLAAKWRPHDALDLPGPLSDVDIERLQKHVLKTPLAHPRGTAVEISSLNAVILGWVLERIGKKPLRTLLMNEVFKRLGLSSAFALPTNGLLGLHPQRIGSTNFGKTAASLDCPWRRRVLVGETQDKVAWLFGGLLGHSGLFGTLEGVHALLLNLLQAFHGTSQSIHTGTIKRFWTRSQHVPQATTTLGWQIPCRDNGMQTSRWHAQSVGQVARAGCAYFIDPAHHRIGVLLTNLTFPAGDPKEEAWQTLRLKIFDAMASSAEQIERQRSRGARR